MVVAATGPLSSTDREAPKIRSTERSAAPPSPDHSAEWLVHVILFQCKNRHKRSVKGTFMLPAVNCLLETLQLESAITGVYWPEE